MDGLYGVKTSMGKQEKLYQPTKKMTRYICWNFKGFVFYELIPQNQTLNSNIYTWPLKAATDENRLELVNYKGTTFYQDNATRQVSVSTQQKL